MRSSDRDDVECEGETAADNSCVGCTLGVVIERRAFLRDATVAAIGIFTALGAASEARALPVRLVSALSARGDERTYPLPNADGATIDREESVIVVRWQGAAYVFSLACPHQNTALKWAPQDAQFQCPKHHSKYRPDGTFIEGRGRAAWIGSRCGATAIRSSSIWTSCISRTRTPPNGRRRSSRSERTHGL